MDLKRFTAMDINMLVSVINMQLRDRYQDLDDLCKAQELDKGALIARLASADFHYQALVNQFK